MVKISYYDVAGKLVHEGDEVDPTIGSEDVFDKYGEVFQKATGLGLDVFSTHSFTDRNGVQTKVMHFTDGPFGEPGDVGWTMVFTY